MTHEDKTLAVSYSRNGYKFTAYAIGTGYDARFEVEAHYAFPGVDSVGASSWEWLTMKLSSIENIDEMPCLYSEGSGDWTISVICNDA